MKKITNLILLVGLLLCLMPAVSAQSSRLTPKPLSYTAGSGEFVFNNSTALECPASAGDSVLKVAQKFTADFKTATGINIAVAASNPAATIKLTLNTALAYEEYRLNITSSAIGIESAGAAGFYFAFQTVKQLMPAAVMAVKPDASVSQWTAPTATIADKPRFPWRGFMLDVGRHFYTKEEVLRVIDIMAVYKLNRFHWHLTEDQGWRVEIKKYPKLTSVGSVRKWSQVWGDAEGTYYDYKPYGPYFYTQEEIREVVAYAKARFIEVVPEIDMPGHFQAALAAYPEYSCTPAANHEVWVNYGVSGDVLNVANPAAISFVKDIIDELIPLFPYKYFHIGGDECPTGAWQANAQCQALLASLGSTNYRDLQTYFFKEIENYLKNKTNPNEQRKLVAWNETLGGDLTGSNVTIMSWIDWYNAAKTAANKKLDVIMTPQIPYYINRKQSADSGEPFSQGSGSETLEAVYAFEPIPSDASTTQIPYFKGVQGNFWTEHVDSIWKVEYLMLPRIAAIAETGWSPKTSKNFSDFVARVRMDTVLYKMNAWSYGKHYMKDKTLNMPQASTAGETHWFRLVVGATDEARKDKCVELLATGSPLLSNSTAKVNRLWANTQAIESATNYNYQWWCIKESPTQPGRYALVNKAIPAGSVKSTATAANNTGRWDYDPTTLYYDFILAESSVSKDGVNYISIRSAMHVGQYMNFAAAGQQFSINLWGNPLDGNSGVIAFVPYMNQELNALKNTLQEMRLYATYPVYTGSDDKHPGSYSKERSDEMVAAMVPEYSIYALSSSEIATLQNTLTAKLNALKASVAMPEEDAVYKIVSTKYVNAALVADANNKIRCAFAPTAGDNDAWVAKTVAAVAVEQAVKMRLLNKNANKYMGNASPVDVSATSQIYKFNFNATWQDFEISGETTSVKTRIFPYPQDALANAGLIARDGVRPQGTGWKLVKIGSVSTSVAADKTSNVSVRSNNGKIIVSGLGSEKVAVFDSLGKMIANPLDKVLATGVYVVKVNAQPYKVLVK